MKLEKVVRHTIKKGANLKKFESSDDCPIIFVIAKKEYLLNYVWDDLAKVLYRDENNGGFPATALLPLKNYFVKSLTLKPAVEYIDFSVGQNLRLNEAGFVYQGKNARLKLGEKLHAEGKCMGD